MRSSRRHGSLSSKDPILLANPKRGRSLARDAGVLLPAGRSNRGALRAGENGAAGHDLIFQEITHGCEVLNKTDNRKHKPQPFTGSSRLHRKRPYKT